MIKSPQQKWRDGLSPEKRDILLAKQRARMRKRRGTSETSEYLLAFRSTPRLVDLVERQPEWWPKVEEILNRRINNGKMPRTSWPRYLDSTSPQVVDYFVALYKMVFKSFQWQPLVDAIEANPKLQHPRLLEVRDELLRTWATKPQLGTPPDIERFIQQLRGNSI